MKKEELRIVYMGTPDFAVESLRALVEGGYNVVGVITMPDKPIGRHQSELSQSPVKKYALAHGLPLLQPEKLKDEAFLEQLRALQADLQIVVAFRMLPEVVWAMPPMGTFNLHAALLPQYRGAAPINWAVINGETETGVTTFFLQHDIDTGNIIDQETLPIGEDDTAGTVHDALMTMGARLVTKTVDAILSGEVKTRPQSEISTSEPLRPAPKLFKETCRIDWSAGTRRVHNFIRGLSPYPAAWTTLQQGGKEYVMKIYRARVESLLPSEGSGAAVPSAKSPNLTSTSVSLLQEEDRLFACLPDGRIELCEVQLSGKKRMPTPDFLRGFHLNGSERLV